MLFASVPLFYVYYPECYSGSVYLFYAHYPECLRVLFSMFITANIIRSLFHCLYSLSQMLFNLVPLFYVYYPECYSGSVYLFYAHYPRIVFYSSCSLLSVQCSRISPRVNLFSMFITANVIRSLFHCFIFLGPSCSQPSSL